MATKYLFYTALLVAGMAIGHDNDRYQPALAATVAQPPVTSIPKYQPGKDSSLFLRMQMGSCTGALYGPSHHVVLTALHCINLGGPLMQVNDKDVDAQVLSIDGHDHVFIHVDQYLPGRPTEIAEMPPAGTEVYIWGNPVDFRSLLRVGRVAGKYRNGDATYDVIDISTWHGDSGGAFFDARGNVVALTWGIRFEEGEGGWDMAIGQPFAFTPAQLKQAQAGA